ncbi:MAG: hypothetical protein HY706_11680 [Candidatus Hydrogenedentes bacterium]|nr:hypothetical protein [Candidatus Hydrogenedentota bacterium]
MNPEDQHGAQDVTGSPERGAQTPLRFSLRGLMLMAAVFVVYDYCAYFFPGTVALALTYFHSAAIFVVTLWDVGYGLLFLILSIVLADDISRFGPDSMPYNLLTVPVAGIAVGNFVVLGAIALAMFFALLRWANKPKAIRMLRTDALALAIPGIYLVATVHGLASVWANPRGAINDLNLPLMSCGLYFAVRMSLCREDKLIALWNLLMLAVAAKALVWTAWFALGLGVEFGTSLAVATESGRVLLVLLIAYGLVLQEGEAPVMRRERVLGLIVAILAGIDILVHATRMAWLETAVVCVTLLLLGRFADKVRWALLGGVCAGAVLAGVLLLRPGAFETVGHFAGTLRVWDPTMAAASHSTMVRVHEFRNIHAQMAHNSNLILGEGPGSRFTDRYHPFPFGLTETDYPFEQIRTRAFEKGHGLLQNLLLNTGYGGTAAYLACMLGFYVGCLRAYRRLQNPALKTLTLALLAFLPAIMYDSWSAKNNMLLGILLGIVGNLYALGMSRHSRQTVTPGT